MEGDGEVVVEVDVTNTGDRAGAEVVQLYLAHPEAIVDRPVRTAAAGSRGSSSSPARPRPPASPIGFRDLARWDVDGHGWRVDAGPVEVHVGASSRDLRATAKVQVTAPAERGP